MISREREALARNDRLYRRMGIAWAISIVLLVLVELLALQPDQTSLLPVVSIVTIGIVGLIGVAVARASSSRLIIVVSLLLDVSGIAIAATTDTGNDATIMLPFLGAVLIVPFVERRVFLAAVACSFAAGIVGACISYGFTGIRLAPGAEPFAVNVAAAAVMTGIGYTLIWWVRDRLTGAMEAARKAADEAYRSERAMETLIGGSPVATFALNSEGRIETWNASAARLFGATQQEILGRRWPELVPIGEIEANTRLVERALAGEVIRGARTKWLTAGGEERPGEIFLAAHLDASGVARGVVGQFVDLTEREALQSRIAEVARLEAVGQLAAGIAHDFNNILSVIGGYAELVLNDTAPNDRRRPDLAEIAKANARGGHLVRQLLAFGRRQALPTEVFDVRALTDGMSPMLRRLIGSEVAIEIRQTTDECRVRAVRTEIEQVVMNLALNARDAMPNGGRLSIATSVVSLDAERGSWLEDLAPGRYARLTVEDTGSGMDAPTLERIFEPFFTTKPTGVGTGLGLSTAYGIARQSGGALSARSTIGVGSTFEVLLPIVAAPLDAEAKSGRRAPKGGAETIVVVDDEPGVREFTRRALERFGYTVLAADGPSSAIALVERYEAPIHLLLTDVVMPEMRGPVLAARLREKLPSLRVVYMSGYAEDRAASGHQQPERIQFLQKPFLVADLARRVRETLDAESGAI